MQLNGEIKLRILHEFPAELIDRHTFKVVPKDFVAHVEKTYGLSKNQATTIKRDITFRLEWWLRSAGVHHPLSRTSQANLPWDMDTYLTARLDTMFGHFCAIKLNMLRFDKSVYPTFGADGHTKFILDADTTAWIESFGFSWEVARQHSIAFHQQWATLLDCWKYEIYNQQWDKILGSIRSITYSTT